MDLKISGVTAIWLALASVVMGGSEGLSLYMQNKRAMEKTVRIYVAFEARHEVSPGVGADLKLPEVARFRVVEGDYRNWVYPLSLGLEVKIGTPQRRVVVMAPQSSGGRFLVGTDDLVVKSYTKKDLMPIFEALEKRRALLAKRPADE
ncbi:hypothetical protein ACFSW8_17725 [Rubritalea tangerina]|uniref:Uncharacterized protein n=2 Tax=Rubritalea tangerina TaxID=430798 RepID=A0ABW4ZFV5_9BACT